MEISSTLGALLGLVIGTNREAATALGQTLAADGVAASVYHSVHLPGTLDPLRHTACDVIIFLCDNADGGVRLMNAPCCSGNCLPRQLRAHGILGPPFVTRRGQLSVGSSGEAAGPTRADFPPGLLPARGELSHRHQWSRSGGSRLQVGDLTLDRKHRTATRAGKPIALSPRETDLLEYLMTHAGEICSLEAICEKAWGCVFQPGTNTVYTNISRLRARSSTTDSRHA